jgi:hypothetical protein
MDNPQDISAVEPVSQTATTYGIEWGVIALGVLLGIVMIIGQIISWRFFNKYFYTAKLTPTALLRLLWVRIAISICLALGRNTVIGFVVGYRARHQPYKRVLIVSLMLFALNFVYEAIIFRNSRGFNLLHIFSFWSIFYTFIDMVAALNGAYLAQLVKRNRGVRIQ